MKSTFLDKLLGRMDRIDPASLQTFLQRLARERDFLETIFNTIHEGLIVADADGSIRYINRAAGDLLGVEPSDAENQPVSKFLRGVDWTKVTVAAEKSIVREAEIFYPQRRLLNFYVLPMSEKSADGLRQEGYVVILSDITESRQRAAATIESERLNALTMLAAAVAHELGNPLNSLNIHLQLLERELKKFPAAQRQKMQRHLGIAQDEIARLDYIITSFLRAMRPAKLNLQLANVNDLLAETLAVLQPELDDRAIIVREQLAAKLPRAPLDATQIKQVFFNVIKNAMQAMTSGGTLTITTQADDTHVIVTFTDAGSGISAERIGKIFEPFQTTKVSGSGLGLMIVQRIIREHGGELELETAEGVGTTFRIRLLIHPRRVKLLEAPSEIRNPKSEIRKKSQ
jgi:PAS domain S-box-containing protein